MSVIILKTCFRIWVDLLLFFSFSQSKLIKDEQMIALCQESHWRERESYLAELETLKIETLTPPPMTGRREGSLVLIFNIIFHWGKVPPVCMIKNKNVLMAVWVVNVKRI